MGACTLVVSTEGLVGSVQASDASTSDVRADAPIAADGPPASDAASDGPAVAFCKRASHTFCADFDGTDVKTGWDATEQTAGGTIAADPDSVSPPNSLRCDEPAGQPSGFSSARLRKMLPYSPSRAHLEFELKISAVPVTPSLFELVKFSAVSTGNVGVELKVDEQGAFIDIEEVTDGGNNVHDPRYFVQGLPVGRWVHVAIDIVFSSSGSGKVTVTLDRAATPALDATNVRTGDPAGYGVFLLGLYRDGATPAATARFDDVALDLQQ